MTPLSERMQDCVPNHPWVAEVAALEASLAAREAEVARLREALRQYGDHAPRCAKEPGVLGCDCGFDDAQTGEKRSAAQDSDSVNCYFRNETGGKR